MSHAKKKPNKPQIRGKSEIKNAKKKKKPTQQMNCREPCKRFQNKKTLKYMCAYNFREY